MQKEFF